MQKKLKVPVTRMQPWEKSRGSGGTLTGAKCRVKLSLSGGRT